MKKRKTEIIKVAIGFFVTIVLHLLFITFAIPLLLLVLGASDPSSLRGALSFLLLLAGIGLWQFLYVIPLALWLKSTRRVAVMKGVLIAAALTFLLNFGFLFI